MTVVKQFFPEEGTIYVHQLRVRPCPQLADSTLSTQPGTFLNLWHFHHTNNILLVTLPMIPPDDIEEEKLTSADDV